MTSTMSSTERYGRIVSVGVAGFIEMQHLTPASRIARSAAAGSSVASTCIVMISAPAFYKLRYITDGIGYHEVNIEYKTGGAPQRGDDTGSEADVRHENSVHNVEMQIFNACLLGAADIISEMRKVAGECGG